MDAVRSTDLELWGGKITQILTIGLTAGGGMKKKSFKDSGGGEVQVYSMELGKEVDVSDDFED